MRVYCIDEGFKTMDGSGDGDYIEEGKTYTVSLIGSTYSSLMRRYVDYYSLKELSGLYEQSLFLVLSNKCEVEILKERNNNL